MAHSWGFEKEIGFKTGAEEAPIGKRIELLLEGRKMEKSVFFSWRDALWGSKRKRSLPPAALSPMRRHLQL